MSTLTLHCPRSDKRIEIDLGEANGGDFDGETLGGNVYLYVDGVEYGSIFVHKKWDGQQYTDETRISLGQYDDDAQEWVERSSISAIPQGAQLPLSEGASA